MMNIKVRALVHSTNTVKEVTLIEKTDDNKYIVRTDSGGFYVPQFLTLLLVFIMQMTFMEKLRED